MREIRIMLGVILISIIGGLTGCAATSKVNVQIENASESKQFAYICKARPIAVSVFDILRSQVEITDGTVSKVYLASNELRKICDNPPKDIVDALVTATKLYSSIVESQAGVATATADALKRGN